MNREWPGNENGLTAPSRHAGMLFNRLLRPNADYAIDFHTSTTGIDMTSLHIARMDIPDVRAMAELFPIDQIFDNPAYPGTLANACIDVGIPAFTPEIGAARILDHDMIALFVEGTMNVLKLHKIIAGPMGRTGKDSGLFIGNSGHGVFATRGGFVEFLIELNDKVTAGQKIAVQRNAFGEVVAEYDFDRPLQPPRARWHRSDARMTFGATTALQSSRDVTLCDLGHIPLRVQALLRRE
jgi:predicted deacylase